MKLFQEENKNQVLNCEGQWRVELKITNICHLRFILDNKLATMYSSGSPEGGSDSSENRGEFLEKLQRARSSVKPSSSAIELFKVYTI